MKAIKTTNLTKSYGKNRGINNINIEVPLGEIFGFIGPNGAGKSTTIKTLLNFIQPTSGEGKILDLNIVTESPKLKELIGYVPSEVRYYADVKVRDIIKYSESFFPNIDKAYSEEICKELELEMDKNMGELSLGNKKKVSIAQALISNPKLIILDEPTNGLDPLMQAKLFDILAREKANGKTIFLSSHNLAEVEKFCDRVAIIKDGKLVNIIDLKTVNRDLGKKITLKAKEANLNNLSPLSEEINSQEDGSFKFVFKKNINELIGFLSKWTVETLLIEDITLEETFLNYYKEEN